MHVLVLGAGLAGVTSAWYLRAAGFQVTVVDRQPEPGRETSFANGGQISVSHPEPWANPGAPATVVRWLGREDAPLLLRPRADAALWRWALRFMRECLPHRTRHNTRAIASLARHSRACLRELRAAEDLRYQQLERGILHLLRSPREMRDGEHRIAALAALGIRAELFDRGQCEALEPALTADPQTLCGGIYAADDESGDAHLFVCQLAARARDAGVAFRFATQVEALHLDAERVCGARLIDPFGAREILSADAIVMCLGSHSPQLMPPGSTSLPIYPVKGYSVTVPLHQPERAPTVSLTEESDRKSVV